MTSSTNPSSCRKLCSRIVVPATGKSTFGRVAVSGKHRTPFPAANITAFIGCSITHQVFLSCSLESQNGQPVLYLCIFRDVIVPSLNQAFSHSEVQNLVCFRRQ